MADLGSVCFHIDCMETQLITIADQLERVADALDRLAPPTTEGATS